jgi:hypothetical protein
LAHFDATGKVVRAPGKNFNKILYYSCIVPLPSGLNLYESHYEIFGMISEVHDQITVGNLFTHFEHTYRTHCSTWPLFKRITTDWSMATINAICFSCNRINFNQYLDFCYEILMEDASENGNIITIHLCVTHIFRYDVFKVS